MLWSILVRAHHIILALLCLAPFFLPSVGSQSYVTLTTQVPRTVTIGTSGLMSAVQSQLVINRSFTVYSTTGTNLGCETSNFPFSANRGEYISGKITTNIAIGFYIMADVDYQSWSKLGNCVSVPSAIEARQNTMNYSFSVALPDPGVWDIVLVNFSNTRNANGFLEAYLTSGTLISTQTLVSTFTQTVLTESTVTKQEPVLSGYSLIVIVGIIATVFAIVIVTSRRILKRRITSTQ